MDDPSANSPESFVSRFNDIVAESESIVVTAHMRPDHDAYCSAMALYQLLTSALPHKQIRIAFSGKKEEFSSLPDSENVIWVEDINSLAESTDLMIYLDGNALSRFSPDPQKLAAFPGKAICIDHHTSKPGEFDLILQDNRSSSTCQLIYELFLRDNKELLTPEVIEFLIFGIMGDTGNLKYIRTGNVRVLGVVAELVEAGDLDLERIASSITLFKDNGFDIFKLQINNTTNYRFQNHDSGLTYSYITLGEMEALPDNADISSSGFEFRVLRQVEGFLWGFTVTPRDGAFKISFRSTVGAPNVRLLVEKYFNGGGHDQAAGGMYELQPGEENWDSDQVCQKIVEILEKDPLVLN